MKKTDLSSEDISRHSRQTDQLRELCLSLMKAKKGHDEKTKNAVQKVEKQEKRDV